MFGLKKKDKQKSQDTTKTEHWDWFATCPRCDSHYCFMSCKDDNVYCAECNYPLPVDQHPRVFEQEDIEDIMHHSEHWMKTELGLLKMREIWKREREKH